MSHYTGSVPMHDRATDWRDRAACRTDPDRMFPDNNSVGIDQAKEVCRSCPVWRQCLRDALAVGDNEYGIRGGMTPGERRALAKQMAVGIKVTVTPPKTARPPMPRPTSIREAVARRTVPTGDGHLQWQGGATVQFAGRAYTSWQAAFIAGHGRAPVGPVTRTCDRECVLAEHLTDAVLRGERAAS